MSDVPKAREILQTALALHLDGADLRAAVADALQYMTRVYTKPKAKRESRKMTPRIADMVRAHYAANPAMSVLDLSRLFGVGVGRISEALAGHWHDPAWREKFHARKYAQDHAQDHAEDERYE